MTIYVVGSCYNDHIKNKGDCIQMDKASRVLNLFSRLIRGEHILKANIAESHRISERSVDRDIETIRIFLADSYACGQLLFDKSDNTYYLSGWNNHSFSSIEVITLLKILIGTRALRADEMKSIVRSIRLLLNPVERKESLSAVCNEIDNYISPIHNQAILKMLEDLNRVIIRRDKIKINYVKANGKSIERIVLPLSFIFSDFYFYLIAFIDGADYKYPAFFRVDRLKNFTGTGNKYSEKLYKSYNTGTMRNCLQFMYAGELMTVKVRCKNYAVETFKDRLPNHWLIKDHGDYKIFSAKVFGNGFIRWALSQGDSIEIIEPIELRKKVLSEVNNILNLYKNNHME